MHVPSILAILVFIPVAIRGEWVHPFDVEQPEEFPAAVLAVIEIPAASFVKYEIDEDTGHVVVDRFVSMPVAYPANYGAVPRTLSGDGDALDVLVLTRTPLHPGVFVEVRTIGYLRMLDGGEADDKILAVPTRESDPTWEKVREVADLPAADRERIESFFRVYKDLPEGGQTIELKGWATAQQARQLLRATYERYLGQLP